jgi:hypothetical protein
MKQHLAVITLLGILILASPVHAQNDPVAKNAFYFELGGNGIFYSINYDRIILPSLSARVGFASFTIPLTSPAISTTTFPILLNYLVGSGNSRFELGAGIVFVAFSGGEFDFIRASASTAALTGVVGYRYQPVDGGLVFRAGFTPFIVGHAGIVSGGVSLGYAF